MTVQPGITKWKVRVRLSGQSFGIKRGLRMNVEVVETAPNIFKPTGPNPITRKAKWVQRLRALHWDHWHVILSNILIKLYEANANYCSKDFQNQQNIMRHWVSPIMRPAAVSTGGTIRKLRLGNGQGFWYPTPVADIIYNNERTRF